MFEAKPRDSLMECEFASNFTEDAAKDLLDDLGKVSELDTFRLHRLRIQVMRVGFVLGDSLAAIDSLILRATQEELDA